jgi:hypothetical protein
MPERQVLSLDEFYRKALAAKQKTGPGIAAGSVEVMETLIAQVEPDPADDRRMTFTVTTAEKNRNGWKLNQQGWRLENYAKNPVMLWVHNDGGWIDSGSHGLPFARAERVWITGDLMKVICVWVEKGDITGEAGELCESVLRLYRKRYLNAVSAGWIPLEWEFVETEDGWEIMCKEQELVEISFVPIPAEPNALREAANAGINVAPVRRWARALLGEPRYVMKVDHEPSSEETARWSKQFGEFYPGAKLLIHGPNAQLTAIEDLGVVKQFTQQELEAQIAAVRDGRTISPKIPAEITLSEGIPAPEKEKSSSTSAAGTPATAGPDVPGERLIPGSREWRIRQLARIDN